MHALRVLRGSERFGRAALGKGVTIAGSMIDPVRLTSVGGVDAPTKHHRSDPGGPHLHRHARTTAVGLAGASPGPRTAKLVRRSHIRFLGTRMSRRSAGGPITRHLRPTSGTRVASSCRAASTRRAAASATAPSAGPEVKGLPVDVSGAGPQPYDGVNAADSRLARDGISTRTYLLTAGSAPAERRQGPDRQQRVRILRHRRQHPVPGDRADVVLRPAAVDRPHDEPPTFPGPSVGDSKCAYDSATGRMTLLTWGTGQDPDSGAWDGTNWYYFGVAQSKNVLGMPLACCIGLGRRNGPSCSFFAQGIAAQCGAGGVARRRYSGAATHAGSGVRAFTMWDIDERGLGR